MGDIELAQSRYCEDSDRDYRRGAGQFFTPRWIAIGMAAWVLAGRPARIVDPAAGFGILLDECRRQGFAGTLAGYEIDPAIVSRCQHSFDRIGAHVRQGDFLQTEATPIEAAIANPPYNRFQNRELTAPVQAEIAAAAGLAASGYTNQYALFLYLVLSRLQAGGRAAFIVPSEFLATGYGEQVKAFLLRNRRLARLVLFDTAERVFPDAATTACVLLFDGQPRDSLDVWHLGGSAAAATFEALCNADVRASTHHTIRFADLDPKSNWQALGRGIPETRGMSRLGAYGDVKRGIATGANEYFVLRPSEAQAFELPRESLVPCVASASSATGVVFDEASWATLAAADKPCWLFDGMALGSGPVQRYLERGVAQGIDQRYLTRMRKPWYRLESRRPAALLLAVFGRDGFKACLNHSRALNLTAFHGFYPRPDMERMAPLIWLYLQGATARSMFEMQQRSYGDGLKKLEPGDWSKLWVPDWTQWPQSESDAALDIAKRLLTRLPLLHAEQVDAAAAELDALVQARRLDLIPAALESQATLF